jgi:Cu+-exporting ATPase
MTVALLTYLFSRNSLATAAVLVVVCSCSFALATPLAMIASVGAGARRGLLIKGGKYLEALNRADVLLLDKTGTLTLGRPQVTDILAFGSLSEQEVLILAASAERYSEHPLAEAVRSRAREQNLTLHEPEQFEAIPGLGGRARVNGRLVAVGSRRIVSDAGSVPSSNDLEAQGKTILYFGCDGEVVGVLAAADTLRPEVPAAIAEVRSLGIRTVELLTGDNERDTRFLVSTHVVAAASFLLDLSALLLGWWPFTSTDRAGWSCTGEYPTAELGDAYRACATSRSSRESLALRHPAPVHRRFL